MWQGVINASLLFLCNPQLQLQADACRQPCWFYCSEALPNSGREWCEGMPPSYLLIPSPDFIRRCRGTFPAWQSREKDKLKYSFLLVSENRRVSHLSFCKSLVVAARETGSWTLWYWTNEGNGRKVVGSRASAAGGGVHGWHSWSPGFSSCPCLSRHSGPCLSP